MRSLAVGSGDGRTWLNAFTTLTAAIAASVAGDIFYISEDHAESTAGAVTLTFPGSDSNPNFVYCVNHLGSVPPISADFATTATVTTTGAATLRINGGVYCYGVTFSCGSGAVSSALTVQNSSGVITLERCALKKAGTTGISAAIIFGSGTSSLVRLINTTLQFGSSSDTVDLRGALVWKNTANAIAGATLPTTLFGAASGFPVSLSIEGVDLSALGSGKTLLGASGFGPAPATLKDCKLGASVTIAATPATTVGFTPDLIRCDSGDTNYRTERYRYEGTLTTETTIVRTGGASDGTTPASRKIITTANSKRALPFESLPMMVWNETVGSSVTVTIEGIWGGGSLPNNDDIWIEAEYLGTSGVPLGSFASSGPVDQLALGTPYASSSAVWGGSVTPFKMSVTFTPQEKGPITIYVKAAKASTTFYYDHKPTLS